jgi:DNA-binding CsgD family transcriptional regulator
LRGREAFARKLDGAPSTELEVSVARRDGTRVRVALAKEMSISIETVRNHVKRVLRSLGASSRVEAVAKARRVGLI